MKSNHAQCGPWRRAPILIAAIVAVSVGASPQAEADEASVGPAEREPAVVLENDMLRFEIAANGRTAAFIDRASGTDYTDRDVDVPIAIIELNDRTFPASRVAGDPDRIRIDFGDSGVTAILRATNHRRYTVLEVVSVDGPEIAMLTFINVNMTLRGDVGEPFIAYLLALNLKTHVHHPPYPRGEFAAHCYPRFGLEGAQVALIASPPETLRGIVQEAVERAPDVPVSPRGGAWAMDAEINRGSYLFNFHDLTEETVDDWIRTARAIGMNQIDFHGGHSFRFGDIVPNPELYPDGIESLKRVVGRLKEAGIVSGLHTYAFFIAKDSHWVTPVPDPRLAKARTLTLAEPLTADATTLRLRESTEDMTTTIGFFERNGLTLQIGDELILFSGIDKEEPYGFTGCQRGAHGTRAAEHAAGTPVHHLKECFYLFAPDPESTLFEEVAARTAQVFNECGFEMIYLDALDGSDLLGGPEAVWHYSSKFVFLIWKHLERPALMEMSMFNHHLWYVRSRVGAWDHPNRSYKTYIDIHVAANAGAERMFMPAHLGWWAVKTWAGAKAEPTFADDIEYLCAKAIGTDTGFSVMHINPQTMVETPAFARLGAIMRQYEELRHAGYFPDWIKEKLRQPEQDFTLSEDGSGGWQFRPATYHKHRIDAHGHGGRQWPVNNPYGEQPLRVRIEAMMSAASYDDENAVVLADFTAVEDFAERETASDVTAALEPSDEQVTVGDVSGRYSATSDRSESAGAWTKVEKVFPTPLDLRGQQGFGIWVHGDGQGQILNMQVRSPYHVSRGIEDHYIPIDFTGWRYFELIEPEGDRISQYEWPYRRGWAVYQLYRELVHYDQVERISLWFNDLPPGRTATCFLGPIKALPLVQGRLVNPSIAVGGRTITFPVTIESGQYLEFSSLQDCKLYGQKGELLAEVEPLGGVPILQPGDNEIRFGMETAADAAPPRARVTTMLRGEPLRRKP